MVGTRRQHRLACVGILVAVDLLEAELLTLDRHAPDAKDLVRARLELITVPEPLTPEMSDAAVEAAMRRVVQRLMQAVQKL